MLTVKLILDRLDKEGRLLERREQQSKSFVKGFIQLLYVQHAQIRNLTPYSMNEIGGVAKDVDSESANSRKSKCNLMIGSAPGLSQVICHPGCSTSSGTTTLYMEKCAVEGEIIGIQVGTGTNAVTPTDYALQTRIAHGDGGGEFEYGGCELVGIVFANPNGEFTIRRYFTNVSGGPITVEEVGIYSVGGDEDARIAWRFLIARDLTGGVAVADGEILRVTYVPQITV